AAATQPARLRLAAVAIRARRGPPLRPALSSHLAVKEDAGRVTRRGGGSYLENRARLFSMAAAVADRFSSMKPAPNGSARMRPKRCAAAGSDSLISRAIASPSSTIAVLVQ